MIEIISKAIVRSNPPAADASANQGLGKTRAAVERRQAGGFLDAADMQAAE